MRHLILCRKTFSFFLFLGYLLIERMLIEIYRVKYMTTLVMRVATPGRNEEFNDHIYFGEIRKRGEQHYFPFNTG